MEGAVEETARGPGDPRVGDEDVEAAGEVGDAGGEEGGYCGGGADVGGVGAAWRGKGGCE